MRLQALRDQDYEAYVRLASKAKDQRLQDLLGKTDDIIGELSGKVMYPSGKHKVDKRSCSLCCMQLPSIWLADSTSCIACIQAA